MYAAEHSGAFPAKLSDVAVPLPEDPFTGKPFLYEVSGKTAHLRGSRLRPWKTTSFSASTMKSL